MGICGACLTIGDDYGDNSATMRCQLPPDHDGPHKEVFAREYGPVTVTWHGDERDVCHVCGAKHYDSPRCWRCFRPICAQCAKRKVPAEYAHYQFDEFEPFCPDTHGDSCWAEFHRLEAIDSANEEE